MLLHQQPQPNSFEGELIRPLQQRQSAFSCSEQLTSFDDGFERAQARKIEDTLFKESASVFALLNNATPCEVEGKTYEEIDLSSDLTNSLLELRSNLPAYQLSCKRKKIIHFRKISEQYNRLLLQKKNVNERKIFTIQMYQ